MKKFILTISVAVIAVVAGRYAFLYAGQIPWFRLNSVQLNCRGELDRQIALKKTRFEIGGSIFKQDLAKACNNLMDMPEIQAVSITRELPSTIQVQVETDKIVLLVKADKLYGLTRGQRLIEVDDPNLELPIVSGIEAGSNGFMPRNAGLYYGDKVKLRAQDF
jgi:cell division septal protein FtsQ